MRLYASLLTCFVTCVYSQMNLAPNGTASQSSDYFQNYASLAITGTKSNDFSSGCSHTKLQHQNWWKVEFNEFMYFTNVEIYHREPFPERNNGFSLYVTNSSTDSLPPNGHLCYKDIYDGYPKYVMDIDCNAVGKNVVYYNGAHTWVTLCYVATNGCHVGRYGHHCEQSCTEGCTGPCHPDTAVCLFGCKDGWMGKTCTQKCANGTFGNNCTGICSANCFASCHHVTGECIGGCVEGYYAIYCSKECSHGNYGRNCNKSCDGCLLQQCDRLNGNCDTANKCKPGWIYSEKCDKPCVDWYFGDNCTDKCNCLTDPCDKSFGICPEGCTKGWKGTTCNQTCSLGHFGVNCSQSCDGCLSDLCDRVDGDCNSNGTCKPGWIYSYKCNQPCDDGYYGHNCSQRCFCLDDPCNKSTGKCKGGCQKGYEGTTCNQQCSTGHFGYSCNRSCDGCIDDDCDSFEGICITKDKCKAGWLYEPTCSTSCDNLHYGDNCTKDCSCPKLGCNKTTGECPVIKDPLISQDSPASAIGGAIAAVIVVAAVVIAVIIFIRRRRNIKQKYREGSPERIGDTTDEHNLKSKRESKLNKEKREDEYVNIQRVTSPDDVTFKLSQNMDDGSIVNEGENEENVYNNVSAEQYIAQYKIQVEDLQKVIKEKEDSKSFQEEYEILPRGLVYAHVEGEKEQNKVKNRFLTTWPYDHSRVVLAGDTKHDYINASYIDNYQKEKAYIATQGPKKNTIRDFWHMIWQENVGKIVMVTKLEEERRKKCEPYWPQSTVKGLIVDNYKLTMKAEAVHTVYVYRLIEMLNKTTQAKRTVHHFHFTQWPDHGVPDQIKLATFYRRVKSHQTDMKGPMVVHCSAGVGRTGTFIAVDALYENGKKTGYIDVIEYVQIMRKDRMNMIQTMEQYAAVYEVLLELFTVPDTAIPAERFSVYIQDQQKKPVPTNQSPIRLEFQKLLSLRPSYTEARYSAAKEKDNIVKNAANILAHDQYRPFLTSYGRKRNDYINAVIIPGYFPNSSFLVTHCPLKDTVVDFWTMIHDHDSNIIVLLEPCAEDALLWCEDVLDFETLSVEEVLDDKLEEDEFQIIVDHKQKDDKRTVKVFSFSEWMTHKEILPSTRSILQLLSRVAKDHQNLKGPVTVVCRDGCTRGGIFVALSLALEKMDMDSEIDIFQVVRTMQIRRPEFLLNFEQYEYCYQCLKDYFEDDSVYANIG